MTFACTWPMPSLMINFIIDHEDEGKLQNAHKEIEPRKRGRGKATKILAQQLMDSEISFCKDRVVTVATVAEWINVLMKAGSDENEKHDKESAAGRKEDHPEPT